MALIIGEKNDRGYELHWSCDDGWHIHVIMKVFMTPTCKMVDTCEQNLQTIYQQSETFSKAKGWSFPSGSVHNAELWARMVSYQDKAKPDSLPWACSYLCDKLQKAPRNDAKDCEAFHCQQFISCQLRAHSIGNAMFWWLSIARRCSSENFGLEGWVK